MVLMLSCFACSDDDSVAGPGPLEVYPNAYGLSSDVDVPVGTVYASGLLPLVNLSDEPVTLVRVEPQIVGDGLTYLGSYVALPGRAVAAVTRPASFPPDDPDLGTVVPAEGVVIDPSPGQPDDGYEVISGFRVEREGRSTVTSVLVTTRDSSGREYTQKLPKSLAICTDLPEGGCPT